MKTLVEDNPPVASARILEVGSRALHHIPDLRCAMAKLARLLRPGGRFILDEHACDRLDEKAALWYLLPPQAREQGALAS